MFPRLKERRDQYAGTLSGGEQQMLAICRALMSKRILMLDESRRWAWRLIVAEIFKIIKALKDCGMTILLVEQMANQALAISDRAYVLEVGNIVMEGTGRELLTSERVRGLSGQTQALTRQACHSNH